MRATNKIITVSKKSGLALVRGSRGQLKLLDTGTGINPSKVKPGCSIYAISSSPTKMRR